jgi:hypothetical protein
MLEIKDIVSEMLLEPSSILGSRCEWISTKLFGINSFKEGLLFRKKNNFITFKKLL